MIWISCSVSPCWRPGRTCGIRIDLVEPQVPDARGPVSLAVLSLLTEQVPHNHLAPVEAWLGDSSPFGIDLKLALYVCYETALPGFAGVDARWEWNAGLLHLRGQLENVFLAAVRQQVGEIGPDENAADEMHRLSVEPIEGSGPSYYLRDEGGWEQFRVWDARAGQVFHGHQDSVLGIEFSPD